MPELVGKGKPTAQVSARVFDSDGNLIADLGTISGGNPTPKEVAEKKKLLKMLKERRIKAEKENKHGR